MEEPPNKDHRRNNKQAEGLVAMECAPLFFAPLLLGHLLLIRLDAAFNHLCNNSRHSQIEQPVRYASV